MWYNPAILTTADGLSDSQILFAMYQLVSAAIFFWTALAVLYFAFKALVWFIPNFWYRGEQ